MRNIWATRARSAAFGDGESVAFEAAVTTTDLDQRGNTQGQSNHAEHPTRENTKYPEYQACRRQATVLRRLDCFHRRRG